MQGLATPVLALTGVACRIGGARVVDDVTLTLQRGEIGALIGPSGGGKTTLLRAIAGLQPIEAGTIALRGDTVATAAHAVSAERRRVGFVFQDLALFPHLTVTDNIAFGLVRLDRGERALRVEQALSRWALEGLAGRRPHQLSGGQQQRVALARALAPKPDVLLLDEPFASLDAALAQALRDEAVAVLRADGVTALWVTHDHNEAFACADRIGVLAGGRLRQWDTSERIYRHPADAEVAGFLGGGAWIDGVVDAPGHARTGLGSLRADAISSETGTAVRALIRPEALALLRDDRIGQAAVTATVIATAFRGADRIVTVELRSGERIRVRDEHDLALGPGAEVRLQVIDAEVPVFAAGGAGVRAAT